VILGCFSGDSSEDYLLQFFGVFPGAFFFRYKIGLKPQNHGVEVECKPFHRKGVVCAALL